MASNDQSQLPDVGHIECLELYGTGEEPERIVHHTAENEQVLAVYYKLALDCGGVTPQAAEQGLALLGPVAEEAAAHPGRWPDIDLLHEVARDGRYLASRIVKKA